jgi:hypothetical protein
VIKIVLDLQQISDFPVSATNKTDRKDITEILLKVALNIINQFKPNQTFCQEGIPLSTTYGHSGQLCQLSPGNSHQTEKNMLG